MNVPTVYVVYHNSFQLVFLVCPNMNVPTDTDHVVFESTNALR